MTLTEAAQNVGRRVTYHRLDGTQVDAGVIQQVNARFMFVRYDGDNHAKATRADDLRFEETP